MDHTEKKIKFYKTSGIATEFNDLEILRYSALIEQKFGWFPFDMFMFTFDEASNEMVMTVQGYNYLTDELIEDLEIARVPASNNRKFYCKLDDHGDCFKAVFMFPDEY